jgi:hypothetical protein
MKKPVGDETGWKVEWERVEVCGFCLKTWPIREIEHKSPECPRLKTINKHRGKFPPVTVEDGVVTWVDKEPTPEPEEVIQEALTDLNKKMETLLKQQAQMLEEVAKLQEKPKAVVTKASKKKQAKAKESEV